ncbi:neprilysin-2-like [Ixodes scapularis]
MMPAPLDNQEEAAKTSSLLDQQLETMDMDTRNLAGPSAGPATVTTGPASSTPAKPLLVMTPVIELPTVFHFAARKGSCFSFSSSLTEKTSVKRLWAVSRAMLGKKKSKKGTSILALKMNKTEEQLADMAGDLFFFLNRHLDQASLGLPDRTYFLKGLNDSVVAAYMKLMTEAAQLLGADKKAAQTELWDALQFEIALANYSLPREERRNMSKLYNKMPLNGLKKLAPQIDWNRYFNSLLVDKVTPDEPISVVVPEFVKQFESLILRTPARTIANYMVWRAVLQSYGMLGKPWRERLQEFIGVLTGQTREMARWEQCIGSLTGYLGMALSSLYVRHLFQEDSKGAALDMVNFILKEFMAILDDINWMDEQTQQRARAKALAIQPHIGYPEELLKDALVEEHYKNVALQPDTYFENVMRLRKWSTDYAYGYLRKPHIKGEWENLAQVAVVDAYYNSLENCIIFPAGILQGVFFSKDRPNYLNYGAIGSIIGHEITHGFDDEGRQFDKDGHNLNWWEPETDLKFRQRAQCIVEQYGNYTVAEGTLNINGVNTQGENIADNGGIKEAFNAYKKWVKENGPEAGLPGLKYTPQQLFWISAANIWCSKYRPEALKLSILAGSHSPASFSYLNYGAIGSIIGHEITHGFDDEGRQFDKDGHNLNWWEPETDLKFRQRAQCIVEQYGNYTVAEGTLNINGVNTQGENIADNGGIKEAFNAYKKWVKENGPEAGLPGLKYTPQQLFWISAANIWCSKYRPEALKLSILAGSHSPASFRVIGPTSNTPEFAAEFNCPVGSPMNPVNKCTVW